MEEIYRIKYFRKSKQDIEDEFNQKLSFLKIMSAIETKNFEIREINLKNMNILMKKLIWYLQD